jgi:hypothetical protein
MVMKGNQIKDNMSWAYGKHWKEEKGMMAFVGKPEGRDHLEDLGTDGQVRTVFICLRIGTSSGLL